MSNRDTLVLIRYRALPGREEEASREIAALVATVLAKEPACGGITIHRELDDPASILLVEWWPSRAAYTGPHLEEPHIRAFKARAPELFAGPPQITFWEPLSKA